MEATVTKVEKKKFYGWIKAAYREYGYLTAYECAVVLKSKGFIPMAFRQATHPRITELVQSGVLVVEGKTFDEKTHKNVTVYRLADPEVPHAI